MKKVTFVSFEQHYYDRHQFYSLTAYLKSKGFQVSYLSESCFDKAIKRLKADKPDLLCYSTFAANSIVYIGFDKVQKDIIGIKSVIGGPGAIFNSDYFLNTTIDAICIGEGEDALVQYLQTNGKSANNMIINDNTSTVHTVKYNHFINLDQMPFPDRELVYNEEPYLKRMKYRMFLSGRGCPYECTYCHNHMFNRRFKNCGKIIRKKSVEYFIEEIKQVDAKYNPHLIVMQDDTFIIDRNWIFEFRKKYKKSINKPFACYIRANLVDKDIVRNLKEAGCVCCAWSIESGNDNLRNTILKRNMNKEEIINAADLMNRYRIRHRIGNIIGMPHETYANVQETIELNIRCKPYFALANTLVPYPGLDITKYAVESGYLDSNYIDNLPNVTSSKSILRFSRTDKIKFLKTTYLFPIFVEMPVLYKNSFFRKLLYMIPVILLKYIHALIDIYKMARMYPFGATIDDTISIVVKYLKYTIVRKKAIKNYGCRR